MSRGEPQPVGAIRVARNGYHYIKTIDGWRLKHHVIVEKTLGRAINTRTERVIFNDRDRTNFDPANLVVTTKRATTKAAKKARLETKRDELQAQIDELEEPA